MIFQSGIPQSGERRLAQWMLDIGTPESQVYELLASTAGLVGGARVAESLEIAPEKVAPEWRYQRHQERRAS